MTRTSPTEPAASLAPSAVSTAVVTLQADMPPSVRHTLAHCTRGTHMYTRTYIERLLAATAPLASSPSACYS